MEDDPKMLSAHRTACKAVFESLLRNAPASLDDDDDDEEEELDVEDTESTISSDDSDSDSDADNLDGDPTAWEKLVEEVEQADRHVGNLLSLTMLVLRAFALKITDNLSNKTFAKLPHAFPRDCRMLWKRTQKVAEQTSEFKPVKYNMCEDSCILFAGPYAHLRQCPKPKCGKNCYDSHGSPTKQFTYLPLIARLKAFLARLETAQKLLYQATEHKHQADEVSDIFNSDVYCSLRGKHIIVNGCWMKFTYFGNARDMALGLSTDGFAPFKRRKATAWPLLVVNYNLPPELRFLKEFVLCVGVIPGPHKPFYFDSFLWLFVQEALKLECWVTAWDTVSDSVFTLRAFFLAVFSDMPAMSMVMRMVGHNGVHPCRFCHIRGVRIPNAKETTHYVPLDRSRHPGVRRDPTLIAKYNPLDLPNRTHTEYMEQATHAQSAPSAAEATHCAKASGIKAIPILSQLSSLSFPGSFLYDFMHLVWENLLPNLMRAWTNDDDASEGFHIRPKVWQAIWQASKDSRSSVPAAYGPSMPNSSADAIPWTADLCSFWTMFLGPVLLR
jgi:hypothetical protein